MTNCRVVCLIQDLKNVLCLIQDLKSVLCLIQDLKKDVSRQSIDDSAFEALEKDFQEVITVTLKSFHSLC